VIEMAGRPRRALTPEQWAEAQRLANLGWSLDRIGPVFDISYGTLRAGLTLAPCRRGGRRPVVNAPQLQQKSVADNAQ